MTVYVVTDGCYSDYHIEAVFTDEEQAKLYCAAHESEDITIEEYDTEADKIISEKPVLKCWFVPIYGYDLNLNGIHWQYTLKKTKTVGYSSWYGKCFYLSLPESKTEEEAKKAISDFYAQWKAERQGL